MEEVQRAGLTAQEFLLRLPQLKPAIIPEEVVARKGNKAAWPILAGISIAQVEIPVGKWRAPHLHTNTPELSVIVRGTARAGLISPQNDLMVVDLAEGDCVFFPLGWTHWLRNTGQCPVQTHFNYGHEQPVTVEVSCILAQLNAVEAAVPVMRMAKYAETE